MNISNFIAYLNKRNGWNINADYYSNIDVWKQWWKGYYKPFHQRKEQALTGASSKRDMFTLRMAKQVCDDWATLLLNEKTTITVGDTATGEWLCGSDTEQGAGGLLADLDFWVNANDLVAKAMRSGTGAFVMSIDNALVDSGTWVANKDASIWIDYLPAECILPLTIEHGVITEAAFVSEVTRAGERFAYLQTHKKQNGTYTIYNQCFKAENEDASNESYKECSLPDGLAAQVNTGCAEPWFSIFRPAIDNTISGNNGMGAAIFADAIDAIKMVDLAFDNYSMDIYLGGKKVFYNRDICETVFTTDSEGNTHTYKVAPDDVRQQLFVQTVSSDPDEKADWHEYNPDLRVEDNAAAVQSALDYVSFKVGLGTKHYQFNSNTGTAAATATQYIGDRQDMVQHAERHHTRIETALLRIFRAVLWAGRNICGQAVNPDADIVIGWDDSYISPAETKRQIDQQDALNGFIPKWKYNVTWRGMSEEEAKAAVSEAAAEIANASSAELDLFAGA